jgi:hypothetical protein
MMRAQVSCGLLLAASCLIALPALAQTPEEQQLKEKVQQLEQLTQELKARIAALEKDKTQPAAPQVVNATVNRPADATKAAAQPANAENAKNGEPGQGTTAAATPAPPQAGRSTRNEEEDKRLDIYGYTMLDMGYNFGNIDPAWFDVMRPTKLPAFPNEFGRDGVFFAGVRQTRFGVKGYFPTDLGEVKTIFEYELFGVGVDAGQTTFRLRHAWGELGQVGAGQTWSVFMDPDVFPNSLEYWGPNGMVFFRNVQLRWMPINQGNHQLYVALERPGASGDVGTLAGRVELQGVQSRFPAPDLSAHIRWGGERDYLQIAGIGRYIAWDDLKRSPTLDLGGHTWGWGVNVSGNYPVAKKDVFKAEVTYGDGIENYMNDAPVDVAAKSNGANVRTPITGTALPVFGTLAFYDRYWNDRWSSSIGYSYLKINNVPLQVPASFRRGEYGLVNLLYYPVKNVMMGGEFQWGRRENFSDNWVFDDYKIQFSFKYNFDYKLGGAKK